MIGNHQTVFKNESLLYAGFVATPGIGGYHIVQIYFIYIAYVLYLSTICRPIFDPILEKHVFINPISISLRWSILFSSSIRKKVYQLLICTTHNIIIRNIETL